MVGVICCEHIGPKRHWTLEEENFSTSIVDFISTAMEAQERVKLARQIEESVRTPRYSGAAQHADCPGNFQGYGAE